MAPGTLLESLADFVNSTDITPIRRKNLERTFVTKEEFNKFKSFIQNDEERKAAHMDITK